MKRIFLLNVFFLLLTTLITSSPLFAVTRGIRIVAKSGESLYLYKDYHALVVGVSDYEKWPDLPNAVKDAREVTSELREIDFKVDLLLNPSSKQLNTALKEMAFRVGSERNRALLFYFAGHGETLDLADGTELGYIIPSDCPLKRDDPIRFDDKAISMKEIEVLALKVKSKHLLMVFDSCFSGSLFNLVRAAPVDITEKSTRPVRQFITAGESGEQVPDKSVFKVVFLDGIEGGADLNSDGYVTGSELGMHLQNEVLNYTRGGQHPKYGKINNPKLDKGDFIFALKAPSQPSTQISAPPSPSLEAEKQRLAEERERLERERQELEQLKMQIERKKLEVEPKTLEAEKKKFEMAKLPPKPKYSPPASKTDRIDRDGRFIAYDNGTVKDTSTGLIWAAKDNGEDINWRDAKRYCENCRRGGYSDWRMPTQDELASLYDRNKKNRHGYHVTRFIDIARCCPWASETRATVAAGFDFNPGTRYWSPQSDSFTFRALPVRAGN